MLGPQALLGTLLSFEIVEGFDTRSVRKATASHPSALLASLSVFGPYSGFALDASRIWKSAAAAAAHYSRIRWMLLQRLSKHKWGALLQQPLFKGWSPDGVLQQYQTLHCYPKGER